MAPAFRTFLSKSRGRLLGEIRRVRAFLVLPYDSGFTKLPKSKTKTFTHDRYLNTSFGVDELHCKTDIHSCTLAEMLFRSVFSAVSFLFFKCGEESLCYSVIQ